MLRKILTMLLCVTLVLTVVTPAAFAAEEEELPLEVTLEVYSDRKGHIKVDGLYLDNVLYIDTATVCELTGAFIHEDMGDSVTFSLHGKQRLIRVTPENGGRLREDLTMGRACQFNADIPCIYYGGEIYTSATHLLRYMGAVVGFGKDESSETHMTVQMPYTMMDLIRDYVDADGCYFSWTEAEGKLIQPEDILGLAALDTILLGYDSNILAYAAPGHADKVGVDYYTDVLKEILRTEGAELTDTGYTEVDFFGDASNVTSFSANWIKEVLGWVEEPKLMSNVNRSMSGALDGAGLLLNVGGDYLKTLDTAMQFANMSSNQQKLLDMTLNCIPEANQYYQDLPNLFAAAETVSTMISGEYNANQAAGWNSIYSLLINASTSAMNSVNPFALAWDTMTSVVKMDPLTSELLNDEKAFIFAEECRNVQVIARDLMGQDYNELYAMTFYMNRDQSTGHQLQEYLKMDIILALKAALTARCLLKDTGWLTEQAQVNMEYAAKETAKLLQKAQNAKPVTIGVMDNRDEDITWIENLAKYKVAYAQFLRNALRNNSYYEPKFQLVYVNDDATPELAISDGEFHAAGVELYTYYDGQVVKIGGFGEYGTMTYAPKQNMMVSFYMGMGASVESYYKWVNNECVLIRNFESILSMDDFETYTYYVDNEEVTKEYYESMQQQTVAGYTFANISFGKCKEVTEENIQKMLKNVKDFIALG